ncbi:uncharacterized protein LOC144567701 [Carex rostrata]
MAVSFFPKKKNAGSLAPNPSNVIFSSPAHQLYPQFDFLCLNFNFASLSSNLSERERESESLANNFKRESDGERFDGEREIASSLLALTTPSFLRLSGIRESFPAVLLLSVQSFMWSSDGVVQSCGKSLMLLFRLCHCLEKKSSCKELLSDRVCL